MRYSPNTTTDELPEDTTCDTVTVFFCYPEDLRGWVAGWLSFVTGRSNEFITHVCFKVGKDIQVDYNLGGTQVYVSDEPYRKVAFSLTGVNRDGNILSRVSKYEKAGTKFHWTNILPSREHPKGFKPDDGTETCCSFTLDCISGINVHFDPHYLVGVLNKLT